MGRLSSAADAERRAPSVADYCGLVAKLERDIAAALADAAASG